MNIRGELSYLGAMTIKNAFRQFKRYPLRFISALTLGFLILLAIILVTVQFANEPQVFRPMAEVYACLITLYGCQYIIGSLKGLSSNFKLYSMADVTLVLTSPLSANKLLIYGFMKQLDSAAIVCIAMLIQYPWLHDLYNLSFGLLFAMTVGYMLATCCSSLTALWLYTRTAGHKKLRIILKAAIIGVVAPILIVIISPIFDASTTDLNGVVTNLNHSWLRYFPVVGWLASAVAHLSKADYIMSLLTCLATIAYLLIAWLLLNRSNTDHYEDVLMQSEWHHYVVNARKESLLRQAVLNRVKLGHVGLGRGSGAHALHAKQRLEFKRVGWLVMYSTSFLFSLLAIVFAKAFVVDGIMPIFIFIVYVQVFTSASGIWLRELELPYAHLIPASPLQKLLQLARGNWCRMIIEAIIVFVPIGIIQQTSVPTLAVCILCSISYSFLLMAGNLIELRLVGARLYHIISIIIYAAIMIVLAAPGIALGVWAAESLIQLNSIIIILSTITIWNLMLAVLLSLFGRKLIDQIDILS